MSNIKCPQCNLTNWSTAISCKRCGHLFQDVQPASAPANDFGQEQFPPQNNYSNQNYTSAQENYQHTQTHSAPNYTQANYRSQNNYGQQNYGHYQGYAPPSQNLKTGTAIASLIFGILGFAICLFSVIAAPTGLILGIVSIKKANRNPLEYGGKGLATAGIVLSVLQLLCFPIILAIAIPNLLAARRAANEASAVSSMRILYNAEATYIATGGNGRCGDLQELGQASLIDKMLTKGEKSGYRFQIVKSFDGTCEITAVPTVSTGFSATGRLSFYLWTAEEGVIRAAAKYGLPAERTDPQISDNPFELDFPNKPPPKIGSSQPRGY